MPPTGGPARVPGNGELMRALDTVRGDIRDLSSKLDTVAVRKDVYTSDRNADALQIKGLEDELHQVNKRIDKQEEKQTATWRLTLTALVFPLLVAAIIFMAHAAVTK